jgi:DNA-binding transcriptional ArsR family regulator
VKAHFSFYAAAARRIPLNRHEDIFQLIGRQEQIEQAARAMKAISHPIRLKILCLLGEQEVSVQEIVEAVGTSQSNISQHLAILRAKDVLATRKDANRVFYRVSDQRTLDLILMMREVFCGIAPQRTLDVDSASTPSEDEANR